MIRTACILLVIVSLIVVLSYISQKDKEWTGFYYKDGDYRLLITSGAFDSESECRRWAKNTQTIFGDEDGSYECGKSCKREAPGSYLCKETVN